MVTINDGESEKVNPLVKRKAILWPRVRSGRESAGIAPRERPEIPPAVPSKLPKSTIGIPTVIVRASSPRDKLPKT